MARDVGPKTAFETWGDSLSGKLVLACARNCTAVADASYGAGRVPRLAQLARSIKDLEISIGCSVVALHLAGRRSSVADALFRVTMRVRGLNPRP